MRPIKPLDNNGSILLRFSVAGSRYSLTPIPGGDYKSARDRATAQAIATRIQNDILAGNFDPTLERYRVVPKGHPDEPKTPLPSSLLAAFDLWTASLSVPDYTLAVHYRYTRIMIQKANPGLTDTRWFLDQTRSLAIRTLRDRLTILRAWGRWAVDQGYLQANHWDKVRLPRQPKKPVQPFTREEIRLILEGFQELQPHYYLFTKFLLYTGVRISEAIGLRWKHLDLSKGSATISESLPIDPTGNSYRRVRKSTKTGSVRTIPLAAELATELATKKPLGCDPEALVFMTQRGRTIDAGNYRDRQWVTVLAAKGVAYRKPHNTRHSLASHALDQGATIPEVTYILGHASPRMVVEVYGHRISDPRMPDLRSTEEGTQRRSGHPPETI